MRTLCLATLLVFTLTNEALATKVTLSQGMSTCGKKWGNLGTVGTGCGFCDKAKGSCTSVNCSKKTCDVTVIKKQ